MSLPNNVDAERAILASIMQDHRKLDELAEENFTADFFFNAKHKLLWEVIPAVYQARGVTDEITVIEHLSEQQLQDSVIATTMPRGQRENKMITFVTIQDINDIVTSIESTASFSSWVQIVKEQYHARQFAEHLDDQHQAVCEQPSAVRELVEHTATWVINHNQHESETLQPVSVVAHSAFSNLEQTRLGEIPAGLSLGLTDLDRIISLRPGTMNVLAARPSLGKSALAVQIAYNAALLGVPSLYFALEMTNIEMTQRLFAVHGNINTRAYAENRTHITPYRLQEIAGQVGELPIWLEEAAPIDIFRIRATARRMQMRNNIGLIVIDYLQLADAENKKLPREQAIGEISRNSKLMAKELNVPVLALAQLNRGVESRDMPRPRLSDLRDSGTLEQDADTVIFISPDTKDESGKYVPGGRQYIEVAKNRGGPLGSTPVFFRKEYTKFENYTPHEAA